MPFNANSPHPLPPQSIPTDHTHSGSRPHELNLAAMGQAMSQVVGAITGFHGADCLIFAKVGARFLASLGYEARPVAGFAAWRVGRGDGDVISHFPAGGNGSAGAVFVPSVATCRAGLFHAWIGVRNAIVDFSTSTLSEKARSLDAVDGGKTSVEWAPQVLWMDQAGAVSMREVTMAPAGGHVAYCRSASVERIVFAPSAFDASLQGIADVVLSAYALAKSGSRVQVVGLSEKGAQTLETAVSAGRARGYSAVE